MNALHKTLFAVDSDKYVATFPKQIVVFARIAGSSSTCSLDKCFNKLDPNVRCVNFGANNNTVRKVNSLTNGS